MTEESVQTQRPVWWVEYRERVAAPRQRMTREMIVRSSLWAVFAEYMSCSSLCGVSYLVDKSKCKKERLFWLILIMLAGAAVLNTVNMSWNDFVAKPIIVTLETHNYPIHNIPFPAVSLCNINRISKKAADEYANKLHPVVNYTLEQLKQQIYKMGRLLDYEIEGYNQLLPFIQHVDSTPDPDGLDLVSRIQMLTPKCEDMLDMCFWQGRAYECSEIFNFRRTMNGYCCNFNYIRGHDADGRPILDAEEKRQRIQGEGNGLLVAVNTMLHDYAYPLRSALGFDIILYDGTTYPDRGSGRVVTRYLEPHQVLFLVIESTTLEATNEVHKYSAETRGCRFSDELHSEYRGLYSYTACIVACRIRTVQSLCKCVPFFLPQYTGTSPVCTLFDLPCLDKYREKLLYMYPSERQGDSGLELELEDSLSCADCLPDCEYTHHTTRTFEYTMQETQHNVPYDIGFTYNKTDKSLLLVFHETRETTLYRMDVLYYWYELISNLGGIASVFVGYSVMAFIELIYFFVFRFYFILRENKMKYS